ncbi:MAG: hypothetical protein NTV11_19970 [Rhodocyclales bacterium]|nr:hypothetical protein [Rhodocyclales bacterium]
MSIRPFAVFAAFAMPAVVCHAAEDIEWRHRATQGGVTLTANPLTTEQGTAFYVARGFSEAAIRPYAQACGFSIGMRNTSPRRVRTTLADWHAIGVDGRRVRLRTPAAWDTNWALASVSEPARIAFRWAQFQAENTFEAGDWIMGMVTLDEPLPGSFRLIARYHDEKGTHEIVLDKLTCSRDSVGN